MIDLLNYIGKGLDQPKHYAQLCTIDFTKAFDRVNHRIVIEKLVSLGVRKSLVPVICSFLMDRTQNTKLSGYISATRHVTCGVPQGTRLGPIICIVLVNDASSDCSWRWKYVDDLTLGQVVKYGEHSNMQHHLNNLSDWCKQNDVLPKPAKCQSMIISFF